VEHKEVDEQASDNTKSNLSSTASDPTLDSGTSSCHVTDIPKERRLQLEQDHSAHSSPEAQADAGARTKRLAEYDRGDQVAHNDETTTCSKPGEPRLRETCRAAQVSEVCSCSPAIPCLLVVFMILVIEMHSRQSPYRITKMSTNDEVTRAIRLLSATKSKKFAKRLVSAADIADEEGLDGQQLYDGDITWLANYFEEAGPGDPPVTRAVASYIMQNLVTSP